MNGVSGDGAAPPDWVARLRARAELPPATPREPLLAAEGGAPIGSVDAVLADRLAQARLLLRGPGAAWRVAVPADAGFAALARWLHEHGLGGRWRDELLAVDDAEGRRAGAIERAAVRPLGITTQAVHLIGRDPQGGIWVQQRALDKATDPGRWDTLVGGLMAADEAIDETLERETWEEAGLHVRQLEGLAPLGRITIRRPVHEGYMVEHIHMFEATVPAGLVPANQDGEVLGFACLPQAELLRQLEADAFTLEAALILLHALGRL